MPEKYLVPMVLIMMAAAMLYAADTYNANAGITGLAVAEACSDSDSNDAYALGITISENFEKEDLCAGNDLLEFYCTQDGPSVRAVHCQNGCMNGACI